MKKKLKKKNEKGIATVESVLLLSIFVVFFTYYMGFFGVIHTGILNSISARAYAIETFRNRANVVYLRDSIGALPFQNKRMGFRAHSILSEKANAQRWQATERKITQGREVAVEGTSSHNEENTNYVVGQREQRKVNPVFIKTTYGICLDFQCGG